jgi:hypothetical protein
MHDFVVALIFVTMVASPAIAAAMPIRDTEDGTKVLANAAAAPTPAPANSR